MSVSLHCILSCVLEKELRSVSVLLNTVQAKISRAEGFFGALVQARVVMLRAVVVLELRKSTAMVWLFRHFLEEGKRK